LVLQSLGMMSNLADWAQHCANSCNTTRTVLLTGCLAELIVLRPFARLATVADPAPGAWLVAAAAVPAVVGGVDTLPVAQCLILWEEDSRAE